LQILKQLRSVTKNRTSITWQ